MGFFSSGWAHSFLLDVHVPNYILYTKCFIWDSFLLDVYVPNYIRLIRKKSIHICLFSQCLYEFKIYFVSYVKI